MWFVRLKCGPHTERLEGPDLRGGRRARSAGRGTGCLDSCFEHQPPFCRDQRQALADGCPRGGWWVKSVVWQAPSWLLGPMGKPKRVSMPQTRRSWQWRQAPGRGRRLCLREEVWVGVRSRPFVWHVGDRDYDADSALFKETTWTHEGAVHDREVVELHPWAKGGSQPTLRVNWIGDDTPFHRVVAFLFCNPDGVPERRWVGGWSWLCSAIVPLAGHFPFSPYDSLLGSICCDSAVPRAPFPISTRFPVYRPRSHGPTSTKPSWCATATTTGNGSRSTTGTATTPATWLATSRSCATRSTTSS